MTCPHCGKRTKWRYHVLELFLDGSIGWWLMLMHLHENPSPLSDHPHEFYTCNNCGEIVS